MRQTIDNKLSFSKHRLCVAPMLGLTDRYFRSFARLLSHRAMLYSELVHAKAITWGHYKERLRDNAVAHPSALQLSGCEPELMGEASAAAEMGGFEEININYGCPSPRGVAGRFGLSLMNEPKLAAECVAACCQNTKLPVTVKCRLGSSQDYSFERLLDFIDGCARAGCGCFIIHARKADLQEFNTKQNRTNPQLDYQAVFAVKRERPHLEIVINGEIRDFAQAQDLLQHVDGVMMGRYLYHNIFLLAGADQFFYGDESCSALTRSEAVKLWLPEIETALPQGVALSHFARHLLGLWQGCPKARVWRQFLANNAYGSKAKLEVLHQALAMMGEE